MAVHRRKIGVLTTGSRVARRTIRAKQEPPGEVIADRSLEIRTNSGGTLTNLVQVLEAVLGEIPVGTLPPVQVQQKELK